MASHKKSAPLGLLFSENVCVCACACVTALLPVAAGDSEDILQRQSVVDWKDVVLRAEEK